MTRFISLALSAWLLTGAAEAAEKDHWHDDEKHLAKHAKHGEDDDRDFDHRADDCYFRPADVQVIGEYYAPRYRKLPPGLQRKLYRTGQLPPGWERRVEPLPVVVERRLVPLPREYRRGVVDGYVVVYNPRAQVVVDVVALFGLR
ncbi:MAG: hypothetical protein HY047_07600 [Acidobacteria bacterium]|nr:hypothetical protein [Acidobacteriota bacterium]